MSKPSTIFLILVMIACILIAGCTQSSATVPVSTADPVTSPPLNGTATPVPTVVETAVPTAAATSAPQEVVTIIRYVSQKKDIKDSDLLFALQVPVELNVSTYRLMRSDTPDYRTDLIGDNVFSIYSYYFSSNQDKAYSDQFRQWSPAPTVTTVTINGITYDRFESASEGKTNVSYVVRKCSANERGYASVLVFTARDSNRFEKEDFEKVVSSFRYFDGRSAKTEPGEEIPLYDSSGNAVSRKASGGGSLAWGEWEGESTGGDSSDGDSSGGSTTYDPGLDPGMSPGTCGG